MIIYSILYLPKEIFRFKITDGEALIWEKIITYVIKQHNK